MVHLGDLLALTKLPNPFPSHNSWLRVKVNSAPQYDRDRTGQDRTQSECKSKRSETNSRIRDVRSLELCANV